MTRISRLPDTRALLMTVAAVAIAAPLPAHAAARRAKVDVIVSNLPAPDSPAYQAFYKAVGSPKKETLEMTNSERWTVPPARLAVLHKAAEALGVTVLRLDANRNRLFEPMAKGQPMSETQKSMMDATMSSPAVVGATMMMVPEASKVEAALTRGMHDRRAGAPPAMLTVPLSETSHVSVRRTSIAKSGDAYVWRGVVEGTDEPVTLMWWPDGHVSGTIHHGTRMFQVKDMGGGMHAVIEMARKMMPPDHAPASLDLLKKMNMDTDPLVRQGDASMLRPEAEQGGGNRPSRSELKDLQDAPIIKSKHQPLAAPRAPALDEPAPARKDAPAPEITITVLVAYTRAAASRYEDVARDLVALAIEEANQSFRNSGVGNVQLKLVHAYQTDYVERGSHFEHVWSFADRGDGVMEEVHALRDKHGADVAMLIVHDPAGCGLATRVAAEADEAFAVVHHECAAPMYSLAHEVGHIVGARHDHALDMSSEPFPYGHGHVHGTQWRTMMSYKDTCNDCPRLPVWSSPHVRIRGAAAGSTTANNAKVIADHARRVAGFR
jgi:hypothetical protein